MRSAEEFIRIYGPPEYRAWANVQDCLVTTCETRPYDWRPDGRGYREICHARNGGLGRKAGWNWTWIGCWKCHDESAGGVWTFAQQHICAVGDVVVQTLMEAAVRTHGAFLHSELGRSWLAREAAGEPPPNLEDLIW